MRALPIAEAAAVTGWSARMLRYIESAGLVAPDRTVSGYRMYGPGHLQRLRTLRALLEEHGLSLAEVGFAARLRRDRDLAAAVDDWFAAHPARPDGIAADDDWLRFEQEKHQRLLGAPGAPGADLTAHATPHATDRKPPTQDRPTTKEIA
jgi:MerR family transcriptional regulator, copper efflux regulator